MNCLVIDDNPLARLALSNLIKEMEDIHILAECESAVQAFNMLQKTECDLLFLDVEMPGMSGLDLIRSLDKQPLVILVTSKSDYAVEGFDLEVMDYLIKPVTFPRLVKAVQRARDRFEMQQPAVKVEGGSNHLFVRVNGQLQRIDFEDILFVQALGDYVVFQTPDKKWAVHMTMKAVEERLPGDRFFRTHRSYIVAVDKILSLEQNSLQIGKFVVQVSEAYKGQLIQRMNIL